MRPIPAEIMERIRMLEQVPAKNAGPMMRAIITKASSDLSVHTLTSADNLGSLDLAMQWEDLQEAPDALWIVQVVTKQAVVNRFDIKDVMDYTTPDMTVTLDTAEPGAVVRNVAIEFDGNLLGSAVETVGAPYIAWLERTTTHDKAYVIQWDGEGSQPAATEILSVER